MLLLVATGCQALEPQGEPIAWAWSYQAGDYIRMLAQTASPQSLKVMKAQVYRHMNMSLEDAMRESNEWMAASLTGEDFKEGVDSFVERRPPNFKRVVD